MPPDEKFFIKKDFNKDKIVELKKDEPVEIEKVWTIYWLNGGKDYIRGKNLDVALQRLLGSLGAISDLKRIFGIYPGIDHSLSWMPSFKNDNQDVGYWFKRAQSGID